MKNKQISFTCSNGETLVVRQSGPLSERVYKSWYSGKPGSLFDGNIKQGERFTDVAYNILKAVEAAIKASNLTGESVNNLLLS